MIDPFNITKYSQTHVQLEEVLLFWILAAGKRATQACRVLERFLVGSKKPFAKIRSISYQALPATLRRCGIGCQTAKARSFWELAHSGLNLRTCSVLELEAIYGIGKKTSRCFLLHSRPDVRYAGLDVHLLHYLRDKGFNVPKSTPGSNKEYTRIEQIVLKLVDESGMTPAQFDLNKWSLYAKT